MSICLYYFLQMWNSCCRIGYIYSSTSSAYMDNLCSSPFIKKRCTLTSSLINCGSILISNSRGDNEHPCLHPRSSENLFDIVPLTFTLAKGFESKFGSTSWNLGWIEIFVAYDEGTATTRGQRPLGIEGQYHAFVLFVCGKDIIFSNLRTLSP